jgi:hypothetical protein
MATTINPEQLFFGGPASLTIGGVEAGATVDAPRVTITPTVYTPEFIGAKGPVKGTDIVTRVLAAVEFTVNEFSAVKMGWTMPGSITNDGVTTWTPGRIPDASYKDVILTGNGLDDAVMVVNIYDAISVQPLEIDFSDTAIGGMRVRFEGRYDPDAPTVAPFDITLTGTS